MVFAFSKLNITLKPTSVESVKFEGFAVTASLHMLNNGFASFALHPSENGQTY